MLTRAGLGRPGAQLVATPRGECAELRATVPSSGPPPSPSERRDAIGGGQPGGEPARAWEVTLDVLCVTLSDVI